jgi:hypothetical protein
MNDTRPVLIAHLFSGYSLTNFLQTPYSKFMASRVKSSVRTSNTVRGQRETMLSQEGFVQQFAQLFHHYHDALSPQVERSNRTQSFAARSVSSDEQDRMLTAARLAITELETTSHLQDSRKYFAKPGEAEWGC